MAGLLSELTYCTRTCLRRARNTVFQIRYLTQTTARRKHGALPTFSETSSLELDALLSTFRNNIFLPSHLLRSQQKLIFQKSLHHHLLGEEPVKVEVPLSTGDTETFTLVPLDHRDEPSTLKSLNKILGLMKVPKDWDILPEFLAGLKISKRKVHINTAQKIVRQASDHGRLGIVMECLRRVESTGFAAHSVGIVREIMRGIITTTVQNENLELDEGGGSNLEKAIKQAEAVLVFMEDPRHLNANVSNPTDDPRLAPDVVAIAMGLVAEHALRTGTVPMHAAKLHRHRTRFLELWPNADISVDRDNWVDGNDKLRIWGPASRALERTAKALEELDGPKDINKSVSKPVATIAKELASMVKDALASTQADELRRGVKLYNSSRNIWPTVSQEVRQNEEA